MGIPLPLGDSSDRGEGPSWRQVADSQGTCQGRGSVPSVAGLRGAGGSPPDSPRFPGTTCHPGQLQTQGSGQRGALGRGATCSPDLCTGSFGRFPSCPSDPAAPWRHTAALGRVSNGPRLEGPAARVTPKPGLCSGLFALVCSLVWQQALHKLPSLPGTLTPLFIWSKHSDPRGWPQQTSPVPGHPSLSQTPRHPISWGGRGLKFNHQCFG